MRTSEPFLQNGIGKYQKALRLHWKLNAFYDFGKHRKTISKTMFWSMQNIDKTLMIPIEFEYFLELLLQMFLLALRIESKILPP